MKKQQNKQHYFLNQYARAIKASMLQEVK